MKIWILTKRSLAYAFFLLASWPVAAQDFVGGDSAQQSQWLKALCDDGIQGNAEHAFHTLRMADSSSALRYGIEGADWQQRLLSAVLLAEAGIEEHDLARVCRILIWHLEDNVIRGDALVAEHALIVLGEKAKPWLEAASWNREDVFSHRVQSVCDGIKRSGRRQEFLRRAQMALAQWVPSLRWVGGGKLARLGLSVPLPTLEQQQARWLLDLENDARTGNAVKAFAAIRGSAGESTVSLEFLERGLNSEDRQLRVLAASLFMESARVPSEILFCVAVECLEQDSFGSPSTINVGNANLAQSFFLRHPLQALEYLLPALDSLSLTLRLRAAAILAQIHCSETERYVPLLLEHLKDNSFPEDAALASQSLALLGERALPWLEGLAGLADDEQQVFYSGIIRRAILALEKDPQASIPFSKGGMYRLEK
ncbi:MAG: hypothetical protein QM477_06610 [Planctomycetota bacterium]